MRVGLVVLVMIFATVAKAQVFMPGSSMTRTGAFSPNQNMRTVAISPNQKWSVSRYAGLSMGYQFFKGGSASVVSAPLAWQLNRRLNDHLFAFGGVAVAPAYVNINSAMLTANPFKANNNFMRTGSFGMYSKAELGLFYTNSEHTFSISGSIGVEKSTYPVFYNGNNLATPLPAYISNR